VGFLKKESIMKKIPTVLSVLVMIAGLCSASSLFAESCDGVYIGTGDGAGLWNNEPYDVFAEWEMVIDEGDVYGTWEGVTSYSYGDILGNSYCSYGFADGTWSTNYPNIYLHGTWNVDFYYEGADLYMRGYWFYYDESNQLKYGGHLTGRRISTGIPD